MTQHRAYIGIGSNVGDRAKNVERALGALAKLGTLQARSSTYRSAPVGKADQPWFANAVALLLTPLPPRQLLDAMQAAERSLGRMPGERWGPRVIDLDLLLYDELEVAEEDLRIPHPRMRERAFVLVPLAELDARFAAMRDALPDDQARSVAPWGESVARMPEQGTHLIAERVRAIAKFLDAGDAVRVRIARPGDVIEVARRTPTAGPGSRASDRAPAALLPRVDTIKADLVGIFHASRPATAEGEFVEGDRELGYIEALGIRTPVHSMGSGRVVSISASDGVPVEYGQPLFAIARA